VKKEYKEMIQKTVSAIMDYYIDGNMFNDGTEVHIPIPSGQEMEVVQPILKACCVQC
jgi:hypothetical protein